MGIDLKGFSALIDDLDELEAFARGEGSEVVKEALKKGADRMTRRAKVNVNSRDGDLAVAIKTGSVRKRRGGYRVTSGVHRADWPHKDYYPAYVEYGHLGPHGSDKTTPPHPYLRPAYDAEREQAYQDILSAVFSALRKIGF